MFTLFNRNFKVLERLKKQAIHGFMIRYMQEGATQISLYSIINLAVVGENNLL